MAKPKTEEEYEAIFERVVDEQRRERKQQYAAEVAESKLPKPLILVGANSGGDVAQINKPT